MATSNLSDVDFENLRIFIEEQSGIAVSVTKKYLIETRLGMTVADLGLSGFGELHERLVANPKSSLTDQVIDAMTTNETLWFRDEGPWTIFREGLLPRFHEEAREKGRRRIRIWCAACSTGQEPYSIAMAFLEFLRSKPGSRLTPADFEVVGTDLSPSALMVASSGRYAGTAADRGLAPDLKQRYFESREGGWEVGAAVKSMVRFHQRNLMSPFASLGNFDVVFCRNVLIYFSADRKRDILTRIARQMSPGGALLIGASESLQGLPGLFKMKQTSGAFFYERKQEERS